MDKIIRGKFLVRKGTTHDGDEILVIAGVFHPRNFSLDEIKNNDEMWVADLIVAGGWKFTDPSTYSGVGSVEEFLEGNFQRPEDWKSDPQPL